MDRREGKELVERPAKLSSESVAWRGCQRGDRKFLRGQRTKSDLQSFSSGLTRDTVFRWRATVDARSRARPIPEANRRKWALSCLVGRFSQTSAERKKLALRGRQDAMHIKYSVSSFLLLAGTEAASGFFDPVDPPPDEPLRAFYGNFSLLSVLLRRD